MYHWFYNLSIRAYSALVRLAAPFNPKAKAWITGRQGQGLRIQQEIDPKSPLIWVHAASLGEAEQAVPVIQNLRQQLPHFKVLLTFFSPSGMEHFRQKELVDHIFYLPSDTPAHARKFIREANPRLALFIKYEIWANYFRELQQQNIPIVLAPALFRKDHFYFKAPHRSFFVSLLQGVSAILTQNDESVEILSDHGIKGAVRSGDTRFEKVLENTRQEFSNPLLEQFCQDDTCLVGGSTWARDEELLKELHQAHPRLKMILAPHDVSKGNIQRIERMFGTEKCFRISDTKADISNRSIAIIDNIGMLSRLYRLGQIAYVGGAFGSGIHNTLEAAVYGMPVFFGPKHQNFVEPRQMIALGFGHEVKSSADLITGIERLLRDPGRLRTESEEARKYIESGIGASAKITAEILKLL